MIYVNLDKKSEMPLKNQIYLQIRSLILNGSIKGNEKLPPSRLWADYLDVSRNTVLEAIDMLIAEGYITNIQGSGIFVHNEIHSSFLPEKVNDYEIPALSNTELGDDVIGFNSGTPDLKLFPRAKWIRFTKEVLAEAPVSCFGYDYPQGRPEFRNILKDYLRKTRNIICDADNIIVTAGAKQALTITAKALLKPDSQVLIEDPSNVNVKKIFSYHTEHIIPFQTDQDGFIPDKLSNVQSPALIFVTPSHQFPMGGVMPVHRRLELLKYARDTGCYIIEDDYDSQYCYNGNPVSSLQEFDPERIIYIGTFSKTVFPSLRIGYMVLPKKLVEQAREIKRLSDHNTNSLNQLVLMRFIESGELERHISKMRKLYRRRRNDFLNELKQTFGSGIKIFGEYAGMHIVVEFPGIDFSSEVMNKIKENGVFVSPVEEHTIIKGNHKSKLILGYAHLDAETMKEGLARLKRAIIQ